MDVDGFWSMIEWARADPRPADEALAARLASGTLRGILDFQGRFDDADTTINRWDVWASAYLIGGGCSDDGFTDFRAGLIAQGRDWYERAGGSLDELADHPAVLGSAKRGNDGALFCETFGYAAATAYARVTGDAAAPDEPHDMGEDFDFDDPAEMRHRLPRLAVLLLPATPAVFSRT